MAKPDKYDKQHLRNLRKIERQVDAVYMAAADEAAKVAELIGADFNPEALFSFSDYPSTSKRVDRLLNTLASGVSTAIINGVNSEWTLANNKNNELCRTVFGDALSHLTQAQQRRYFSTNPKAQEAFIQRKVDGLRLSDRVWNYSNLFKNEIELGLDLGIRGGLSADEMSRQLRQYLRFPDMLFRRVRDEHGDLVLSKRAAAFHPGRGVYRSSYKNARRLAATECNIAYRTADHLRWQDLDFVVGIEIHISQTNHPIPDICDDLKGKYPKDFKFTGWHPHCRCYATSVLKTEQEIMEDNRRIIEGEPMTDDSVNTVTDVPKGFRDWVRDNRERLEKADSLPYFIEDNRQLITSGKYGYKGERFGHRMTAKEKSALSGHEEAHNYSDAQQQNFRDIVRETGFKRGTPMTFQEADSGKANIYGDEQNCAACVLTHELRLRGFDITALPYRGEASISLSADTRSVWLTAKGKKPEFSALIGGTESEIVAKVEKATQPIGSRYHLAWDKSLDDGHIITAVRTKDGLILYDPQKNKTWSLSDIIKEMKRDTKLELLRVDRLLVKPDLLNALTKALV
jgi:hypothetical protein